jgi:hypothetical protein
VIRFDEKAFINCKHLANNLQIIESKFDLNLNKLKAILKKCRNIKCLEMNEIIIN